MDVLMKLVVFSPLWLFHAAVARGRFSLPAPSMPHDRHWAPFHAVMSTPLLVAFELLLCIHLDRSYVVSLKIVFLPLLAFEIAILIDNIRMCRALMPGDEESLSDAVIWETLPGTPPSARNISTPVLFSPLLLLQGAGIALSAYRLIEKIVILLHGGAGSGRYIDISSKVCEFFGFLHHGSSLLGWWSIDEGSREEQARLYCSGTSGYNTFSPDIVKKRPKSDLVEEIWRLQAALSEQTEVTKYSQQEFERLQYEKILCRVCFEEQINVVLLPCRHHVLCRTCCEKCKRCPICRVSIEERLSVYDV
ncbi:Detected protein of confused Function [Hibiscus syriacus]|uniref:Detected protein of confused Function n=1 Tax=Hibiscus syriacus TaxID=106335 RepID=A0A6A2XRZ5_HIBSY|nr:Detected protein of confused Function [Hibiscus syriacus]